MAVSRYCNDCMENGEFLPLKFVMLNISSGMWTCPKTECIFPMSSPLLQDYMEDNLTTERVLLLTRKHSRRSKKKQKSLSKDALLTLQDETSSNTYSSSSRTSDKSSSHMRTSSMTLSMTGSITSTTTTTSSYNSTEEKILISVKNENNLIVKNIYPIWENEGLLCWLDAALSLLVFNTTLVGEVKLNNTDSVLCVLITEYYNLLRTFKMTHRHTQISSQMKRLRRLALNFIQPKLLSNYGDEDSPLFSLPLLFKTEKKLYEKLVLEYKCEFLCNICGFEKADGFTKVIMTLPNTREDLNFDNNICFTRPCYRCSSQEQKTKLIIEKFPLIMITHFPEGATSNQYWLDYNFTSPDGEHYMVTQVIQYINHKQHFVLWAYSYQGLCMVNI